LALHRGAGKAVLTASVAVTNTGSRAGIETVQLYVGLQGTSVAQPVRALAGFRRTELAPGETKRVRFELGPEAFALWDAQQRFAVEASSARVWISSDAAQGAGTVVSIGR
jgi:beta-glucosidase